MDEDDQPVSLTEEQLAEWLAENLTGKDYGNIEVVPEDWGWLVVCRSRSDFGSLALACGNRENARLKGTGPLIWKLARRGR